MREWRPRLPATTPASQMGLLHGTTEGIPAFRWVDRATGRVYVANRPADARDIEALHSDGHGLLADDGVSVSNLFTGDAPVAYATMSAVDRTQETLATRRAVSRFLARPDGLARGISRTVAEVVRERFQAARARRRDLRPRVHRGWAFAVERAALNGVLRDLNTSLVATSMLEGRRVVYVDYVDYDAVAHHAGMLRPESLDALAGIDAVLAQLEKVAAVAPRPYRFVVLSDHGQSQGEVFADRYGEDLAALVSRLARATVTDATAGSEAAGRLGAVTASAGSLDTAFGRALHAAGDRIERRGNAGADRAVQTQQAAVAGRSRRSDGGARAAPRSAGEEFLVFGSGNLGLVYVAGEDHRLSREELDARFPALWPVSSRTRGSASPSSVPPGTASSPSGRTASTGSSAARCSGRPARAVRGPRGRVRRAGGGDAGGPRRPGEQPRRRDGGGRGVRGARRLPRRPRRLAGPGDARAPRRTCRPPTASSSVPRCCTASSSAGSSCSGTAATLPARRGAAVATGRAGVFRGRTDPGRIPGHDDFPGQTSWTT